MTSVNPEIDLNARLRPLPPMTCGHVDFTTSCTVERVEAKGKTPTTWLARVRVRCADCGRDFDFQGMPQGESQLEPRAGLLGIEAQLPLTPSARDPLDCNV